VQFVAAIMLGLEVHRVDNFSQPLSHRETTLTEVSFFYYELRRRPTFLVNSYGTVRVYYVTQLLLSL